MRSFLLVTASALFLGSLTFAASEADLLEAKRACFKQSDNAYLSARPGGVDWEKLKELARKTSSTRGLQSAFANDAAFARLLRSYVLIGTSRSAVREAVSPQYPRKVFFEDGLIVAFSAHADEKLRKLNQLAEVIFLDCSTEPCAFRFKEIDFNQSPPAIDENPTRCAGCHGGRPIWPTYDVWPGVYATNADFRRKFPQSAQSEDYAPLRKDSIDYFHTRFKAEGAPPVEGREPFYFGAYLHALNTRRIASEVRLSKDFKPHRFALLASLIQCGNLDRFRPRPEDTTAMQREKWVFLREQVQRSLLKRTEVKRKRFAELKSSYGGSDYFLTKEAADSGYYSEIYREPRGIVGLNYYLGPAGVAVDHFTLDIEPTDVSALHGFFAGIYLELTQVACHLLPDVVRANATADRLLRHGMTFLNNEKVCAELLALDAAQAR